MRLEKAEEIIEEIWEYSEEERIPFIERVLQTQLGGYGYGDQIAGTRVLILRRIANKYKDISLEENEILLQDDLHEARFIASVIMIAKFKKQSEEIFQLYLRNTRFINNWDLVDVSSPHIVGKYCLQNGNTEPIWNLANSENLWENRMSIVSSWVFVKNGDMSLTIDLAKHLMNHKHHLIHKAIGWILREIGKKNQEILVEFLKSNKQNLPKITYNYAKERVKEFL
jgi:3-methyladenine DNA glycosylase AlkD